MTLKLFKKLLTLILVPAKVMNNNELLKCRPHFNLLFKSEKTNIDIFTLYHLFK